MKILLIDGQGGKLGKELVERINSSFPEAELVAVGTNALATSAMLKAGAKNAATGENPVIVNSRDADVIIGPVGIVIADSLLGEITPEMALAVSQSRASRILIPASRCKNIVAGVRNTPMNEIIDDAVEKLAALMK